MKMKTWTVTIAGETFTVRAVDEVNARREARAFLVNSNLRMRGLRRLPRGTRIVRAV